MKVYRVGGAVRDELLGYPYTEQDWVVVGANPVTLLKQGFKQVGRDFPVFLHPVTKDEYALARTERKKGTGYYGFECHFDADVTLEEDLMRRDLTINAMAMDESGQLIDPFHGLQDLQNRILRHVSPAFIEDPVRVLRVARFMARYAHLGFQVAEETRLLMYKMTRSHELNHLVPERIWQEFQKSLAEKHPEQFIETLRICGALRIVIPELDQLFGIPNLRRYHPEVDSGVHSLLALQAACKITKKLTIRFAALVHDLGKAATPMSLWPAHHAHDALGESIIRQLCHRLRIPNDYRDLAMLTSRFHLTIHQVNALRPATIVNLLERADAFRRPQLFLDLLTVCAADEMGKGQTPHTYSQEKKWHDLLSVCQSIDIQSIRHEGLEGKAIKTALHAQRVQAVKHYIAQQETKKK